MLQGYVARGASQPDRRGQYKRSILTHEQSPLANFALSV